MLQDKAMDPPADLLTIVARLEALASPVRLQIFRLLVEEEPQGLVSGDIAERLGHPHNGLSFHLKNLQHAGLVMVQREGRYQRYRAAIPVVHGLVAYLTENCCRGTQQCPTDHLMMACKQGGAP